MSVLRRAETILSRVQFVQDVTANHPEAVAAARNLLAHIGSNFYQLPFRYFAAP